MEYVNENPMIERDLSPTQIGRLSGVEEPEEPSGGCCSLHSKCSDGWGLATYPLAMVYAPCQGFHGLYDLETALMRGTLFSELDLPLEVVDQSGNGGPCGGCGRSRRNTM